MQKGKIESITPKEWKNPEGVVKKFVELVIEGVQKQYSCWDASILLSKVGDEIEYTEVEKNGRWSLKLSKPAYTGKPRDPQRNESFAASYSKDIAVAALTCGAIKGSKEIDATLEHYYLWFLNKLEAK
jgi:hypothetical protein